MIHVSHPMTEWRHTGRPGKPDLTARHCLECLATQEDDHAPGRLHCIATDPRLSRPCGQPAEPRLTVPEDIWGRATSGKRYVVTPEGTPVSLFEGPVGWGRPSLEGKTWMFVMGSGGSVEPTDYEEGEDAA